MSVVALEGFVDLAQQCRTALGRKRGRRSVEAVAVAYLTFAGRHPAVYEAMFQQPIEAHFAADDTESELRAGFAVLAEAIGDVDQGSATELFWGALHGISLLERSGRMRLEDRPGRVVELGARFASKTP